jgi:hypothetical protein
VAEGQPQVGLPGPRPTANEVALGRPHGTSGEGERVGLVMAAFGDTGGDHGGPAGVRRVGDPSLLDGVQQLPSSNSR